MTSNNQPLLKLGPLELERLKRAYVEGKASGEPQEIDFDAFLKELKAELASRSPISN